MFILSTPVFSASIWFLSSFASVQLHRGIIKWFQAIKTIFVLRYIYFRKKCILNSSMVLKFNLLASDENIFLAIHFNVLVILAYIEYKIPDLWRTYRLFILHQTLSSAGLFSIAFRWTILLHLIFFLSSMALSCWCSPYWQ